VKVKMIKRMVGSMLLVVVLALLGASAVLASSDPAQAERLYNETPISGTLAGNRGGAYAYYKVEYPGDGNVVSVEVTVSPGDPAAMKGLSLKLYNASGSELGVAVPIDKGLAVPYSDSNKGTWTVQFANYLDGTPVAFTIVAKGLPTVALPTIATSVAAPAVQAVAAPAAPASGPTPMSGILTGNGAGAFAHVDLGYPADDSEMTVTLTYNPANPATRMGVGLTVYGPDGQSWKGEPGETPGEFSVTLNSSTAGKYEAVVWNYIPGFTINYTLTK
jgi:hypothetical protein